MFTPVSQWSSLITSHAQFVRDDRATVAVKMEVPEPKPTDVPQFSLLPTESLELNRWYRLEIQTSATELKVTGGLHAPDASGVWALPFFTGSAPHVAVVGYTTKHPLQLAVGFSEPIELSTLPLGEFASQNGTSISKCFDFGNGCLTQTTAAADGIGIDLTAAPDFTKPLELVLGTSTMGAGSTVGDSAAGAGYGAELTSKGLVTTVEPSMWAPSDPDAHGWAWGGVAPGP
jgi:hypothetical protein